MHNIVWPSPDAKLDTRETAAELSKRGRKTSPNTLTTLRCRGGGPPFVRLGGRQIRYVWRDVVAWDEATTSAPVTSNAELRALMQAAE